LHAKRLASPSTQASDIPLPVHYEAYFTVSSSWNLFLTIIFGALLSMLAPWRLGRRLLLAFPGLFSAGIFSHAGPSETQLGETSFAMTFFVKGFLNSKDNFPQSIVEAKVQVRGPEPGYVATPRIILCAALTLLEEKVGTSIEAGVLTPATAFRGTKILDRLRALGISFEFMSSRTL